MAKLKGHRDDRHPFNQLKDTYDALVGDLINHIRETGLTITDLNVKSGVAFGSISAFLSGETKPRLDTVIALATAANCQLTLVKNHGPCAPWITDGPANDSVKIGYINKNGMEIIGHELRKDRSQRQYRACIMKCLICAEEKVMYPAATYQHYCKRCRNLPLIDRIRNSERIKNLRKNKNPNDFSAP